MTGEVIERTYKHVIPTPEKFFNAFREKYSSYPLPIDWDDNKAWTPAMLDMFAKIGRDFGYKPRKEWLSIDQVWEIRHDDLSLQALAFSIRTDCACKDFYESLAFIETGSNDDVALFIILDPCASDSFNDLGIGEVLFCFKENWHTWIEDKDFQHSFDIHKFLKFIVENLLYPRIVFMFHCKSD